MQAKSKTNESTPRPKGILWLLTIGIQFMGDYTCDFRQATFATVHLLAGLYKEPGNGVGPWRVTAG